MLPLEALRSRLRSDGAWYFSGRADGVPPDLLCGGTTPFPDSYYPSRVFVWDPELQFDVQVVCPNCRGG